MQDRYATDIGDFGKFQLLRYLFNNTNYKLTQLWYMYPDERHNNDGMYINYFEKVKGFDNTLEESFQKILKTNRSVKALQEAKLLENIKYFGDFISKNSLDFRTKWFEKALTFSKNSDVLLVDPDNGIATKCKKIEKTMELLDYTSLAKKVNSGKYIFFNEIKALYKECSCLIIYHHLNRCFAHDLQIKVIKELLQKDFKKVLAIKHKPYSPRVYFFLCNDEQKHEYILTKLKSFENSFSFHWKLFL